MKSFKTILTAMAGTAILSMGFAAPAFAANGHTVSTSHAVHSQSLADDVPLAPDSSGGTSGNIGLYNDHTYRLVTHGPGSQVTIQSTGWTGFYITLSSGNSAKIHISASTNCLTDEAGTVITADCQQGAGNQQWLAYADNPGCLFRTMDSGSGANMVAYDNANGRPVWVDNHVTTGWRRWWTALWPGCLQTV